MVTKETFILSLSKALLIKFLLFTVIFLLHFRIENRLPFYSKRLKFHSNDYLDIFLLIQDSLRSEFSHMFFLVDLGFWMGKKFLFLVCLILAFWGIPACLEILKGFFQVFLDCEE